MTLNNNNNYQYPNLPTSIIWPTNPEDISWYMEQLYEQLVFAINQKDNGVFQMAISTIPTMIPNMDTTGSYLVNLSGSGPYIDSNGKTNYWPAYVFQMTKCDPFFKGLDSVAQNQDGRGPTLNTVALLLTQQQVPFYGVADPRNGPYYYFIQHDGPAITGSFNVNIQGTKL